MNLDSKNSTSSFNNNNQSDKKSKDTRFTSAPQAQVWEDDLAGYSIPSKAPGTFCDPDLSAMQVPHRVPQNHCPRRCICRHSSPRSFSAAQVLPPWLLWYCLTGYLTHDPLPEDTQD